MRQLGYQPEAVAAVAELLQTRCDKIPSAGSLHHEMLRYILDDDRAIGSR